MPHGGSIRIEAKAVRNSDGVSQLELRFRDTGPGIQEKDREKIFVPYFSTKATGFGLGLAITRKIIEDHGGQVYVSRLSVPGTEMVLELPLSGPRGAHSPALAETTAG